MSYTTEFQSLLRVNRRKYGYDEGNIVSFREAILRDVEIYRQRKDNECKYKKQNDCKLGKTTFYNL